MRNRGDLARPAPGPSGTEEQLVEGATPTGVGHTGPERTLSAGCGQWQTPLWEGSDSTRA